MAKNGTSFTKENAREMQARGNTPDGNRRRGWNLRRTSAERQVRNMLTEQVINELHNIVTFKDDRGDPINLKKMQLLAKRLVDEACKEIPNISAASLIFDRVEGKTQQKVEVTHDGDVTIRSAAISALDELVTEALGRSGHGRSRRRSGQDAVPDGPLLLADVRVPEE